MPLSDSAPIAQSPELVTKLVAEIKAKLAPLDLRKFQAELYRKQKAKRESGIDAAYQKMHIRKHRNRVRMPLPADCKVIDTRRDSSGKHLYFELSNGQALSARRILGTRDLGRAKKLGRRSKRHNPILVAIAAAEVLKNETRAAA